MPARGMAAPDSLDTPQADTSRATMDSKGTIYSGDTVMPRITMWTPAKK